MCVISSNSLISTWSKAKQSRYTPLLAATYNKPGAQCSVAKRKDGAANKITVRQRKDGAAKTLRQHKKSQIHYDNAENYEVVKKLLCSKKYEAIKKERNVVLSKRDNNIR
jgi:hypothetical protein